jgi:polysaccharide export outer membrane protein
MTAHLWMHVCLPRRIEVELLRSMMKTAIWSAILIASGTLCGSAAYAQQSADPSPQGQKVLPPVQPGVPPPARPAATATQTESPKGAPPAAATDDDNYVIGPEDSLNITVWGDQRLSGSFLVRSDGRISVNLVGEVMASGKTPAKLSKELEELLKEKEILRRPQVNVQVTAMNSRKYSINGEVLKPGAFPLAVPTNVMQALVNAGGFKDFANKRKIEIIRGDQRLKFNWNEVIKGKKTEQNIFLQPGDIIIVP